MVIKMIFINKLIRMLPKKRVDVNELERNIPVKKLSQAETIIKSPQALEHMEYEPTILEEENQQNDCEYEIVEREIVPEKIICPDCGGITLEGLEFCDKCGGELGNNL